MAGKSQFPASTSELYFIVTASHMNCLHASLKFHDRQVTAGFIVKIINCRCWREDIGAVRFSISALLAGVSHPTERPVPGFLLNHNERFSRENATSRQSIRSRRYWPSAGTPSPAVKGAIRRSVAGSARAGIRGPIRARGRSSVFTRSHGQPVS